MMTPSVISPTLGPATGATTVTVTGTEFLSSTVCKFGTVANITAAVTSSTQLTCNSPALPAGFVTVELSGNALDYTHSLLAFMYYTDTTVTAIIPSNGPVSGHTHVTVTGANFVDSSLLVCQFGTLAPVQALWGTPTVVYCESPAIGGPGAVALEVGNNNAQFSSSGVVFTYQADATATALSNAFGPTRTPVSSSCLCLVCYMFYNFVRL